MQSSQRDDATEAVGCRRLAVTARWAQVSDLHVRAFPLADGPGARPCVRIEVGQGRLNVFLPCDDVEAFNAFLHELVAAAREARGRG